MIQTSNLSDLQSFYNTHKKVLHKKVMEVPLGLDWVFYGWSRNVIRKEYDLPDNETLNDIEPILLIKEALLLENLISPESNVFQGLEWANHLILNPIYDLEAFCSLFMELQIETDAELNWLTYIYNAFSHIDSPNLPTYHGIVKDYLLLAKPELIESYGYNSLYYSYSQIRPETLGFDSFDLGLLDWVYVLNEYLKENEEL